MNKEDISIQFQLLQDSICENLEILDGKASFGEDLWERSSGGGGRTRTIANGDLIEKGGVAFSAVHGEVTEEMQKQLNIKGNHFFATGVSIVLHPHNPHVPIIHMNVRYFQMDEGVYWFGGGIDLTPHYVVESDAAIFHNDLREICDKYDVGFYPKFKKWADEYFYIPHRNETRGVGGIFYDHLSEENTSIPKERLFDLALDLGNNFVPIYSKQVEKGRKLAFSDEEIAWRNIRRGRYVEFNLVNDRGTKFGLHSGGRTESILMSLPPRAEWEYNFEPILGSKEENTLNFLKKEIIY